MDDDYDSPFSILAKATALRAQRDIRNDSSSPGDDRAASTDPKRPPRSLYIEESARNEDGTIAWDRQLSDYLRPMRDATLMWGLVDDWSSGDDGSVVKRQGIIIEVTVDVTKAILQKETRVGYRDEKLENIRHAIDMIHLLVTLNPECLQMMLNNPSFYYGPKPLQYYASEFKALARGEPWEVKLKFQYFSTNTAVLPRRFVTDLVQYFDQQSSYYYFAKDRMELLHEAARIESPRLQRLAQLANRAVVRAEIVFVVNDLQKSSVLGSEDFFEFLPAFLADLERYQSRRKPRTWNKHAPFRVEKVWLHLGRTHITSQVLRFSKALAKARIPVQLASLGLDLRLVGCPETDLRKFLQVITIGTTKLTVSTGVNHEKEPITADAEDQNRSKKARMFLGAIAEIKSLQTLNIDGILGMCTSAVNREAVWRGLFECVLSRDQPTELKTIRLGTVDPPVAFTAADAQFIAEAAARWRKANPLKKLRLHHLDLHFHKTDMTAVRALLSAFDDVERVALHFSSGKQSEEVALPELSSEDLLAMLRYPSISKIYLSGVSIPTMDLFNPSISDPRLPIKPALQQLNLSGFRLVEQASLTRFLDQLKHNSDAPNRLARKLTNLRVIGARKFPVFDRPMLATLDEALAVNDFLQLVIFSVSRDDDEADKEARKLTRKHTGRIVSGHDANSKMAMVAFLSTLNDSHSGSQADSARARLDSTLVSRIFSFSATRLVRTVQQDFVW